jgi:hypothetical protein
MVLRRLGALLILGAVAFPLPARVEAAPARVYLMAVGNNQGHAGEIGLRYAERDARELSHVLQQLGGISSRDTLLLLGEDASVVRTAIIELNERIRNEEAGKATLLVFYSGHADSEGLHLGSSTLPFEELRSMVSGSSAKMRLLVVDSCRSGGVTRVKGLTSAPDFEIALDLSSGTEGMAILTSSSAGESSQESDLLRSSFFSHHLVSGLRGAADQNADGRVTLEEAYSYAYHQTLRSSGRTLAVQHPTFEYDMVGQGDLVLTRIGEDLRGAGTLHITQAGRYMVFEGREGGPLMAELVVGERGASIVLPPRVYFVQRRGQSSYREYVFTLDEGQRASLEKHSYRTVAYDRLVRKGGGERKAIHGLSVLGGARGELFKGDGVTVHGTLSYSLDFSWLTLGVRGRFATWETMNLDGVMTTHNSEYGFGLSIQRFVDLSWFSLGFGLLAEAVVVEQSFESTGDAPSRRAVGAGFAGLLALEGALTPALTLRFEGGPYSIILDQADTSAGSVGGVTRETPMNFWAASGLVWRF